MGINLNFSNSDEQTKPKQKPTQQIIDTPRQAAGSNKPKVQRRTLWLPITQQEIQLSFLKVPVDKIVVSPFNQRTQSLLSTSDPEFAKLIESIENDNQREPVLLRPIEDDKYELIWGSRRLFCIDQINIKNSSTSSFSPLLVDSWVSSTICDADAKRLSASENENRRDISPYEKGLYYKFLKESESLSVEQISLSERIATPTVYEYIRISSIPINIVKTLCSPNLITVNVGLKILAIVKNLSSNDIDRFCDKHIANPFQDIKSLLKALAAMIDDCKEQQVDTLTFSKKDIKAKLKIDNNKNKLNLTVNKYNPQFIEKLKTLLNSFD